MRDYIKENKSKSLSNIIFNIRSKILNIKDFQPWMYEDNLCVKCETFSETMDYFSTCKAYETEAENSRRDIYLDDTVRRIQIAELLKL